jgi:predicted kinase
MSKILIVAGDLAAGKSNVARKLSAYLKVPYFSKEHIKEILGEEIEYSNREDNKKLSNSAIDLLLHILERSTAVGKDVILEANFHKEELEKVKQLCEFNQQKVVLLYLTGDIDVLYERFLYREMHKNRHPVHLTHPLRDIKEFEEYIMKWRSEEQVLPRNYIDVTNCDRDVVFAKALETLNALEQESK